MKKEIVRLDIGSVTKIFFFTGLIGGLILGIIFAIMFVFISAFGPTIYPKIYQNMPPNMGSIVGLSSIIIFPIGYALFGAIFGLLLSGFYNIIARTIGGIKLEFKE